jgi:hypothetical protein
MERIILRPLGSASLFFLLLQTFSLELNPHHYFLESVSIQNRHFSDEYLSLGKLPNQEDIIND